MKCGRWSSAARLGAAAFTFLWVLPAAAVEPLNFKGLAIGKPATTGFVEGAAGVKCAQGARQMMVCNGVTTLGGRPSTANIVIDAGVLSRVSLDFPPSIFDVIVEGLTDKFGKPMNDQREKVQTRMGATLENRTLTWRDGTGNLLRVSRYGARVDEGSYLLVTPAHLQLFERVYGGNKRDM